MSGSFTWSAIVQVGTLKPYSKALVITVVHELERFDTEKGASVTPVWNTIICFRKDLRHRLESDLTPGDLVHFEGYVRTGSFTDETEAKRRSVDLVITRYDCLQKHIDSPKTAVELSDE